MEIGGLIDAKTLISVVAMDISSLERRSLIDVIVLNGSSRNGERTSFGCFVEAENAPLI